MKQRFEQLRREAWSLPYGKQKLAVLEEAVRIADLYMTKEDAYYARITYSEAALDSGYEERFIVSFTHCLTQFEREPASYSVFTIMWHYKWFLNLIWRFPQFSCAQINAVFDDYKAKCLQYGYSLRPYYQNLHRYALSCGDFEAAQANYELWRKTTRDGMSDCRACEQNSFGCYHFQAGRLKRGLQAMKPILAGQMSCKSIPLNTYSHILFPLLETNQHEEAAKMARKGSRLLKESVYLIENGNFLAYYTSVDLSKAAKWFERTVHSAIDSKNGWDRLSYLTAARAFLAQWQEKKKRSKLAVRAEITYEWLKQETDRLAQAFDARNQNDYCTRLLHQRLNQVKRLSGL